MAIVSTPQMVFYALLWVPHHLSCHGESRAIPFLSLVCLPCVRQDQSQCPRKGQEAEPNTKDVSFRESSREKGQNQENQCLWAKGFKYIVPLDFHDKPVK